MNSLNKPPTLESSNILKAEVVFSPELDSKYASEIKVVLDRAAMLANTTNPTSASYVEGSTIVRGKERRATIQNSKFPELFSLLVDSEFLDKIFSEFFLIKFKDKNKFINFMESCMVEDKKQISEILEGIDLSLEDAVDLFKRVQEKYAALISPRFLRVEQGSNLTSSDIINNILFVRTSIINVMEMERQMGE